MIAVIHKTCGKPAFYFKRKLNKGDVVNVENVVLLNGEHPKPLESITCGSCNEAIAGLGSDTISQQHWTDWFIPDEKRKGEE